MQRLRSLTAVGMAVFASLAVVPTAGAAGTELLQNGSFESGFTSWTTAQMSSPLTPWTAATAATRGYFVAASPRDGTRDALNGFDGSPGAFTLTQQVTIPAASSAALAWQDRLMWAMVSGATARTFQVRVLSTSDALLATPYSFTTGAGRGTCCSVPPGDDTGWQSRAADLSAFAGQTVRVQFHFGIPQSFTGPGQAEIDAVSLTTIPLDTDGDGLLDTADNCPSEANPDQTDADGDGTGSACDTVEMPATKSACGGDGWQDFHDGDSEFRNKGDCMRFVAQAAKGSRGAKKSSRGGTSRERAYRSAVRAAR